MTRFESDPMTVPSWLIIQAVRYATGRRSYAVSETASWVVANWERLPEHAQTIIRQDLEGDFRRDNELREQGSRYLPLGMDCDRRQWERVRALWANSAAPSPGSEPGV